MPGMLVDEVSACRESLDLHVRPEYLLSEFISLLGKKAALAAAEHDALLAVRCGEFPSKQAYFLEMFGVSKPTSIPTAYLATIVDGMAVCAAYDNCPVDLEVVRVEDMKTLGAAMRDAKTFDDHPPLVESINKSLENETACARVMSKKSLLDVSLPLIVEEADALAQQAEALLSGHDLGSESLTAHERAILAAFAEDVSSPGARLSRNLDWLAFYGLYHHFRVPERYPLYGTEYGLYIPPAKRLAVADPIEQVILESTKNPSLIRRLTPREFERFLAKIFEAFRYEVELTAATRDGGVDILCLANTHGIPIRIAVEAKRYAASRPVTVGLVRAFVGANAGVQANKLVYVTTSRFTRDAVNYAQLPLLMNLLELKGLPEVIEWANEFKRIRYPYTL